jgi:hypothetical protein
LSITAWKKKREAEKAAEALADEDASRERQKWKQKTRGAAEAGGTSIAGCEE